MAWGPIGGEVNLYHGPNKVPELDNFESIVNGYCETMTEIGFKLIDAFELAFNLNGLREKFASEPRVVF